MRASFVSRRAGVAEGEGFASALQGASVMEEERFLPEEPGAPQTGFDVRARMAVTLLASAATIVVGSFEGQAVLFAASFAYALSVRRFRALAVAYAALALMMGIAAACSWGVSRAVSGMPFSPESLVVPFLRSAVMLNVVLPLALASRIQALLTALKGLRLPFCVYLPGAVMIRFIPTFMNDVRQVAETLKIRGCSLGPGEMFRHPLMMLRLLLAPLLFRSLRTSEELGIAAELKGLEACGRFVPFRRRQWSARDTALVVLAVAAVAAALYCHARWGSASSPAMR